MVAIVGKAEALAAGERAPEGALFEATEKAPIVAEDGTSTTGDAAAAEDGAGVSNQVHQTGFTSITPLRGGDEAGSGEAGLSDEHPRHRPQTGLNEAGEAGEAGSTKDGNGSDQVVSEGMNGSQSDIAKAVREQLERFNKGKSSAA